MFALVELTFNNNHHKKFNQNTKITIKNEIDVVCKTPAIFVMFSLNNNVP